MQPLSSSITSDSMSCDCSRVARGSALFRRHNSQTNILRPGTTTPMRHSICAALLLLATARMWGQTLKARPPEHSTTPVAPDLPKHLPSIPLTVVAGTPIRVSLDQEVRIQKVGQPIHGKTTQPIYAFDKLLIPAGSSVIGKVAEIDPVSKKVRTLSAMNANFSPDHRVRISFDELVLADGRHLPMLWSRRDPLGFCSLSRRMRNRSRGESPPGSRLQRGSSARPGKTSNSASNR